MRIPGPDAFQVNSTKHLRNSKGRKSQTDVC